MGEPLHILVAIDNFYPLVGGAEAHARESAAALAARGHRVDVLAMRKDPEWPPEERLGAVRIVRFDERVPPRPFGRLAYECANASAARRFADRKLAGDPYDVILLFPIDASFGVARSQVAAGAVLIYNFTTPLSQEHWVQARGLLEGERRVLVRLMNYLSAVHTARYRACNQRATIHRCAGVSCPSEYSRELLCEWMPAARKKRVQVIAHGVDAARFRPAADRAAVRARLGWAEDDFVLFTARRLVPRMGLGELIRGFGLASERRPDFRLVIGGRGPLRGRLEALARRAGGRVEFAGFVPEDDLPGYFQGADLCVLPSIALEAFGLMIVEALACGTPVLAANRCAMPEILGPLDPRLLIPRDDAQAVAEAILGPGVALATEPFFRERCRDYAVAHYSWDRAAAAYEELARELLGKRRPS